VLSRLSLVTETFPPEVNGVAMTLNRLSANLVDRGIDLQVVHPTPRARYEWGQAVSWDAVNVFGFPIPGYPEAQVGLPSWLKLAQIWRQQRPDVVHVATEGILGLTAALTARAMKIPLVTSFHTNFHEYAKHYRASLIKPLVIQYLKTIHRLAEINLVPDPDLIVDLKGHGFRDCRYFGRGVDTDLFSPEKRSDDLRRQWGVGTDGLVILHVSRVAAEKNIQLVLDNIMTLRESGKQPGLTGVIVGDGPERKRLEKKYPELVFAGMRFDEDLATHYASGDLFCFASETETFGNVILRPWPPVVLFLVTTMPLASNTFAPRSMGNSFPSGMLRPFPPP